MVQPARASVLLLAVLALFLATPSVAEAGDISTGKIDFEARLEPADLKPGDSGTLIIEATLLKDQVVEKPKKNGKVRKIVIEGHHIYAKGDQAMTYVPLEAKGVTYDLDKLEITKPIEKKDDFGDIAIVWKKTFTVTVPVTLAADAAADARLGMSFTYNGCTLGKMATCYPPVKNHVASIMLGAPKGGVPAGGQAEAGKPAIRLPAPSAQGEGEVSAEIDEDKKVVKVTFTPNFGWYMYGPDYADAKAIKVAVSPVEQEGVTWGKVSMPPAEKIEMAYTVTVPYERKASVAQLTLLVTWQACQSGLSAMCAAPHDKEPIIISWPGVEGGAPVANDEPAPTLPQGDVLFPVVDDDELSTSGNDSQIAVMFKENALLAFGLIFLAGLGLAFTPCVLPIIPITVSVISGGNADIPKKRLAALLGVYVIGLAMTFGVMGVIAAMTGGAMSALFAMPIVQWGIALLFLVLGFGMFGVYELQPPAWLMNLQGGAQRRSGSMIGAFLFGCLGAIIASPCTGPAIASMLILVANEGSIPLGFSMFFMLGLGMGSVFFAVGSLNFATRPGPWMVWVRYTFGMLLIGAAMYYLRNYNRISETGMWIFGIGTAILAAIGIAWHLHKKEGEDKTVARNRGIKVAVLTLPFLAFVAWYTRVPDDLLSWTYIKDPDHLQELVAKSQSEGKPVVIDFWGEWCTNCKVYDKKIAEIPELRERFERITRLKVDLTEDYTKWPIRHALGVEESGAPVMVFIDKEGRIRRNADVVGLLDPIEDLAAHIDVVLDDRPVKTSSAK